MYQKNAVAQKKLDHPVVANECFEAEPKFRISLDPAERDTSFISLQIPDPSEDFGYLTAYPPQLAPAATPLSPSTYDRSTINLKSTRGDHTSG
jgi:hypothetical protein